MTQCIALSSSHSVCEWIDNHPKYKIISVSVEYRSNQYTGVQKFYVFYQEPLG